MVFRAHPLQKLDRRAARRKTPAAAERVEVFEGIPSCVVMPAHPKIQCASKQLLFALLINLENSGRSIWILKSVSRWSEKG